MQFQYRTADAQGKIEQGKMEANSREQLITRLKSQGKFPLEVKEVAGFAAQIKKKRLSGQERLNFIQQLAGLLSAGVPLDRALGIMGKLQFGVVLNDIIFQLHRLLQEGLSFTNALEKFPEHFPPLFVNMVKAGEAGGILPQVLSRLAQYQEEEISLQRYIIGSLIYPLIVMAFSIVAIFFFVAVLIPQFQNIFQDMGTELPLVTKIIMLFGQGLLKFWWVLALLIAGGVSWFLKESSTAEGRFRLDKLKLRIPVVGELLKKIATARMALALSLLNGSGVSLLTSLNITSDVVGNEVLARALRDVEHRVRQGNTLANSLANQTAFPVLAKEMIAVGEESGNLDKMLEQVSKTYDGEVKHALNLLLSVLQPLMTLILVGVIALLAIAILLPIINMNSQITGIG